VSRLWGVLSMTSVHRGRASAYVPLHHPTAEVLSDNDRPRSTRLSDSAQVQPRAIIRCLIG
jgi:hypothetical protein